MTITVKEKEHWKKRISRKIEQAIEEVLAAENPHYMEQIRRKAKGRALESLGIAGLKEELSKNEAEKEKLDKQRSAAMKQILATVRGVAVEDIKDSWFGYNNSEPLEVTSAIHRRELSMEQQLLEEDELGRRILRLQQEKEELLDTVWLAASHKQIKELWRTVTTLLNQSPTELQKEAMNIEPMTNSDAE